MRKTSGLKVTDTAIGKGLEASRGCTVHVRYSCSLNQGEQLQSDQAASFTLGKRSVIPGLEYGVEGMRVGGRRTLEVSPHLAYRDAGVPGVIPPNAKLIFDVELLKVAAPESSEADAD